MLAAWTCVFGISLGSSSIEHRASLDLALCTSHAILLTLGDGSIFDCAVLTIRRRGVRMRHQGLYRFFAVLLLWAISMSASAGPLACGVFRSADPTYSQSLILQNAQVLQTAYGDTVADSRLYQQKNTTLYTLHAETGLVQSYLIQGNRLVEVDDTGTPGTEYTASQPCPAASRLRCHQRVSVVAISLHVANGLSPKRMRRACVVCAKKALHSVARVTSAKSRAQNVQSPNRRKLLKPCATTNRRASMQRLVRMRSPATSAKCSLNRCRMYLGPRSLCLPRC